MSIEKAIADQTAAITENTEALRLVLAALQDKSTTVTNTGDKAADAKPAGKSTATGTRSTSTSADPIYWAIAGTDEFGTVATEAEWKKLKKAKPKAVKIPLSKYETLAAAASDDDDSADGDYSDRIVALVDAIPENPDEGDIVELFKKYLPKDLDKAERTARAEIIKPILESVNAAKATAVSDDDRYDVMVSVVKGIELHLEETGQVSDDDDGLV